MAPRRSHSASCFSARGVATRDVRFVCSIREELIPVCLKGQNGRDGGERALDRCRDLVGLNATSRARLLAEEDLDSSLNQRFEARGASAQDEDWQAFLGKAGPLLEEMHSMIMLPADFSPMQ